MLMLCLVACTHADINEARNEAKEFVKHFPNATGVECNESDSDGDGYVSCTIFRDGDDPLPIACGAENWCVFNCARGCKVLGLPSSNRKRKRAD